MSRDNFSFSTVEGVRELLAVDVLGRAVAVIINIGVADSERRIDGRAMEFASYIRLYDPLRG